MADDRILEGDDIFIQFPTNRANVDSKSTDDGFLSLAVAAKAPI